MLIRISQIYRRIDQRDDMRSHTTSGYIMTSNPLDPIREVRVTEIITYESPSACSLPLPQPEPNLIQEG
jgi:hypothetical protein